jgi:hypothetical protein
MLVGYRATGLQLSLGASPCREAKRRIFFKTDPHPYPYTGPQEKAGSVIKGGEKNFLLESLGAPFAKPY